MTGRIERVEGMAVGRRKRRWSALEKLGVAAESRTPGSSVSGIARRHGINSKQLSTRKRPVTGAAGGLVGGGQAAAAIDRAAVQCQGSSSWMRLIG